MTELPHSGDAIFPQGQTALWFTAPRTVLTACHIDEVAGILAQVEKALATGKYAAGFVAFEAAPAFEPGLAAHAPGEFPLAWFGIYDAPETRPCGFPQAEYVTGSWESLVSQPAYDAAIAQIREHIAAGDTYQVNYTFPLRASFSGDVYAFFGALCAAQGAGFHGFIDTGRYQVLSASPELFFQRDGDTLITRPMKGTRPRGRWPKEDAAHRQALCDSEKDRAENLMIVDLLRNDLGRIADTGSVAVSRLFDVERYETVWQMTSTITARTAASLPEIFTALFPCGSVTGAPKIETMKIIHALEPYPRGVYCGTVGWAGPDRRAVFNVAIRTVTIDRDRGAAVYSVGSGITWDSSTAGEYQECLDKAAILGRSDEPFELLESMRYDAGGYYLLEEHLERLAQSAAYFGFSCDLPRIRAALYAYAEPLPPGPFKVRLLLDRAGRWRMEHAGAPAARRIRLGFAAMPVDSRDVFLFHKTTRRGVYQRALETRPDCDDVLLWNHQGEITESAVANVVLQIAGEFLTPPVASGLLPGTFRKHLLDIGRIREARLVQADVFRAEAIYLINSVREWIETDFADRAE